MTTEPSKDAYFDQLAQISDAMSRSYGKDFAMGALVLAARFIAEKEGRESTTQTEETVNAASH